jgi:hypothetical protein
MVSSETRERIENLATDEHGLARRSYSDVQREAIELGLPIIEARSEQKGE